MSDLNKMMQDLIILLENIHEIMPNYHPAREPFEKGGYFLSAASTIVKAVSENKRKLN